MILKERKKSKQLLTLEALEHRVNFTPFQSQLLKTLRECEQLEQQFAPFVDQLDVDAVDIIWQFHYSDYHHDAVINLVVITAANIHLFKLNNYAGLHYVNAQGMLADYFTEEVKIDLIQLNCVKHSIKQLLDASFQHLPIYIKSVCMNPLFTLDTHSSRQYFLLHHEIDDYFKRIKQPHKKKLQI